MKPNLLLDLDNTLVYSDSLKKWQKYAGFKRHVFKDLVIVERPYLQEFLTQIMRYYNVSVWTAATQDYALFIVDNILLGAPNRTIYNVFHRQHVQDSVDYFDSMKNLDLLTKVYKIPMFINQKNIIMDDLSEVCRRQKNACLNVAPFYGKDVWDDELVGKLQILVDLVK